MHNELMRLLGMPAESHLPAEAVLYAVVYRPIRWEEREEIDLWPTRLEVGGGLPTLPLRITAEVVLPVDLHAAYEDVCQRRRMLSNSGD